MKSNIRKIAETPMDYEVVDCLAAIIGGKDAQERAFGLTKKFSSSGRISSATINELRDAGLTETQAGRVFAAYKLIRKTRANTQIALNQPEIVFQEYGTSMIALEQEELWILVLNIKNALISIEKVYKGSVNTSQARICELFRAAVRQNAASVIAMHNHPSGDPTPSADDIIITRALVQAGRLLDIHVLDHIVVGDNKYVSMKERNLGFS